MIWFKYIVFVFLLTFDSIIVSTSVNTQKDSNAETNPQNSKLLLLPYFN